MAVDDFHGQNIEVIEDVSRNLALGTHLNGMRSGNPGSHTMHKIRNTIGLNIKDAHTRKLFLNWKTALDFMRL
jgi:hypothetical protein